MTIAKDNGDKGSNVNNCHANDIMEMLAIVDMV